MPLRRLPVLLAFLLAFAPEAEAQPEATRVLDAPAEVFGRPFLTNYLPTDYGASTINWAIAQDARGVLYVGNDDGLLSFDGSTWSRFSLPNRSVIRSLAVDDDGRLYVGGLGELGYLDADSLGRTRFVSLTDRLPEAHRAFDEVWEIHATPDGVYFEVSDRLLRWNGSAMEVFPTEASIHLCFYVEDTFYVQLYNVGLLRMESHPEGDRLELVPGGERFADVEIYAMLPFGDGRILVGSLEEGLFLYDGDTFERFRTEADAYLTEHEIYLPGAVLPGGRFALGTVSGGVVVIDRTGRLIETIDQSDGLQNNTVNFTYVDREGGLWTALDNGISRVEVSSPLRRFGQDDGLSGQVNVLERHQGRLYAGLSAELMGFDETAGRFLPVDGAREQCFDLLAEGPYLLAACNTGLLRVTGDRATHIRRSVQVDFSVSSLHRWRRHPEWLVVGLRSGVTALRLDAQGALLEEVALPGTESIASTIAEAADGTLWIGAQQSAVLRIPAPELAPDAAALRAVQVERFGPEQGLPEGQVRAFEIAGEVFFSTPGGFLRHDSASGRFVPDSTFSAGPAGLTFAEQSNGAWAATDDAGQIWLVTGHETTVAAPQPDGGYSLSPGPFQRVASSSTGDYIYPDPRYGAVWLPIGVGLVRYDATAAVAPPSPFNVLIRSMRVGSDQVVYHGMGPQPPLQLPYRDNAVRFTFSAPSFSSPTETLYRTRLEGWDPHASSWATETVRDYTNLPEGTYVFHVEALNVFGRSSETTTFAFTVLPPWHRTWWSYLLYALALVGVLAGGWLTVSRRMQKKEQERVRLWEAELRAEAENEQRRNVELLSTMGQAITSTLSIREIINTVYAHVNELMDAAVFGIGIYNASEQRIDFPANKKQGETLPSYYRPLDDPHRLAAWCFNQRKDVVINDYAGEHHRYIEKMPMTDGLRPQSVIYLPLVHHDKGVGVITAQSFEKDAYTDYHVNLLRTLATYTAIALDNASAYRTLGTTVDQLNSTLAELKTTQQQLITQEKLASLGQLTAGIAHEIKNPLNFITNFGDLNAELADELDEMLDEMLNEAVDEQDVEDLHALVADLKQNATVIATQGRRADAIVRGMMAHARSGSGGREQVDVNALVNDHVDLAYHGKRAQIPDFSVDVVRDFDEEAGRVNMVPQEIGRVVLNLVGNAFDAVLERKATGESGYLPRVSIRTRRTTDQVEIRVADNGPGVPTTVRERIFEPFFTTKPTGTGTGLGLSLSYDIITKGHGGTLALEHAEESGAVFVLTLPAGPVSDPPTE